MDQVTTLGSLSHERSNAVFGGTRFSQRPRKYFTEMPNQEVQTSSPQAPFTGTLQGCGGTLSESWGSVK